MKKPYQRFVECASSESGNLNFVWLYTRKRKAGREFDRVPMTPELHDKLSWWKETPIVPESEDVFHRETTNNYSCDEYAKPFELRQHFMEQVCDRPGRSPLPSMP